MLLKNRIIATTNPLPFLRKNSNGEMVVQWEAKVWDNLKNFIGKKEVPIIDGHPEKGLYRDNPGAYKVYGKAEILACPNKEQILCANIDLNDDAPKRSGYSIGYPYNDKESTRSGIDAFQMLSDIDHIALVDHPRQPIATNEMSDTIVGKDSKDNVGSEVIKYRIGYDSFRAFEGGNITMSMTMTPEQLKELMELREFKAKAEAEKVAGDSFGKELKVKESEIKKKDEEYTKLKTEYDSLSLWKANKEKDEKAAELTEINKKTEVITSVLKKVGKDSNELKGMSTDFVKGAFWMHEIESKIPRSGAIVEQTGGDASDNKEKTFRSTADFKFAGLDKNGNPIWK